MAEANETNLQCRAYVDTVKKELEECQTMSKELERRFRLAFHALVLYQKGREHFLDTHMCHTLFPGTHSVGASRHESVEGDTNRRIPADDFLMRQAKEIQLGKIPLDELIARVRAYEASFEQKRALLREQSDRVKLFLRIVVDLAVKGGKGWLPVEAQNALARIDGLPTYLVDRFNAQSGTDATHGSLGSIHVRDDLLEPGREDELHGALTHEFLHELSGKSITAWYDDDTLFDARERKIGVSLNGRGRESFDWLNEAITQWLTMELRGEDGFGKGSYFRERRWLRELLEQGLSIRLVLDAYFENITNEQPKKERGQLFTKLVKAVNELLGPRAFTVLENRSIIHTVCQRFGRIGFKQVDESVSRGRAAPIQVVVRVGARDDARLEVTLDFPLEQASSEDREETQKRLLEPLSETIALLQEEYGNRVQCEVRK